MENPATLIANALAVAAPVISIIAGITSNYGAMKKIYTTETASQTQVWVQMPKSLPDVSDRSLQCLYNYSQNKWDCSN